MTIRIVKKVMSVLLAVAMTVCIFSTVAYADVSTSYDSEFGNIFADDFSESLQFTKENSIPTNYNLISAGNNYSCLYLSTLGGRYNYYNFNAGSEVEIESKLGYDVTHGFMLRWEIFTNIPETGTTEVSVSDLRFVTDYATCSIYVYYGDTMLAKLETGLTAGSYEFQSVYAIQEYTLTYIDGGITVSRLTDGLDEEKKNIIKYGNNIVWTLADGTENEKIPMPENADFGYSQIRFKASAEIGKCSVYKDVPIGFHSNYNGNGPLFSYVNLVSNCGFSSLQSYVDFISKLTDEINATDIEYARKVYNAILEVGTDGFINEVSQYEHYITEAESILWSSIYSDYNISATAGGNIYCDGEVFNNDSSANPIKPGTVKTFTATPDTGYTFAYWADADGSIVSRNKDIDIAFGLTTVMKAVFTKDAASQDSDINIYFSDRTGNIVSVVTAKSGSEVTLPDAPYTHGYTFTGWVINGTQYSAGSSVMLYTDTVINAAYSKNNTNYTVSVSGSVESIDSTYTYNTLITATFDKTLLKANEAFAGWSNGTAVVSYDEQYSFFVGADVSITALISSSETETTPLINISNVSVENDGKVASFLTERWLPENCTFIESGTIYTNDVLNASKLTVGNVNGDDIRKATTKFMTNHGQFRLNLGSKSGAGTFYVAAYLSYIDAGGEYQTIYTSVYSQSTTAANA